MIVKDRLPNEHDDTDPMAAAGARAEGQMAFYLKRAFGDAKDVLVMNDLRLPSPDSTDAAQIDHLVLHTGGIVLIESKSVTSEVSINKSHEFSRLWNGRWQGFKSPVQQSKLQVEFLRKALAAKAAKLRDKAIFGLIQQGFGLVPFDILVAISDTGIIRRKADVPEVLKSDQVADRIREIMSRRCISFLAFNRKSKNDSDPWVSFTISEMQRISDFLVASHRPLPRKPVTAPPVEAPASPPAQATTAVGTKPVCHHCASIKVAVTYGKYGYFLKCAACDQNTKIDIACSKCGKGARIRKNRLVFYRECQCGHAEIYHVNER
jgi:hypothetical protein